MLRVTVTHTAMKTVERFDSESPLVWFGSHTCSNNRILFVPQVHKYIKEKSAYKQKHTFEDESKFYLDKFMEGAMLRNNLCSPLGDDVLELKNILSRFQMALKR